MALRITHQEAPVTLTDPTTGRAPKPVPGCDVCASRMKQWKQASQPGPAYDPSHATDLLVEIGRHPHGWKYDRNGKRVSR